MVRKRKGVVIMKDFSIQIECEGYGFHIILDPENIITKESDILHLSFSKKELNQIIDKLQDIMDFNNEK